MYQLFGIIGVGGVLVVGGGNWIAEALRVMACSGQLVLRKTRPLRVPTITGA